MKHLLLILSIFVFILTTANGIGVTNTESEAMQFERNNLLLSAKLLIEQLRNNFSSNSQISSDVLYKEMARKPEEYLLTQNAQAKLKQFYAAKLKENYKEQIFSLLSSIEGKNTGISNLFSSDYYNAAIVLPEEYINKNINAEFSSLFNQARTKICQEQKFNYTQMIYPTELEIDQYNQNELIAQMENKLFSTSFNTLFEENRKLLTDSIIIPAIKDAYAQREEQRAMINQIPITESFASAEEYNKLIKEKLNKIISDQRPTTQRQKIYQFFPSLGSAINDRSSNIISEQLIAMIPDNTAALNEQLIYDTIKLSLSQHSRTSDSEKIFQDQFKNATTKNTIEAYQKKYNNKSELLSNYFQKVAMENKHYNDVVNEQFQQKIAPAIQNARNAIFNDQFATIFPSLKNNSFAPSENSVLLFRQTGPPKAFRDFNQIPGLSNTLIDNNILLEETVKEAKKHLYEIFKNADMVYGRQLQIVENNYNDLSAIANSPKRITDDGKRQLISAFQTKLGIPEDKHQNNVVFLTEDFIYPYFNKMILTQWRDIKEDVLRGTVGEKQPQYNYLYPQILQETLIKTKALIADLQKFNASEDRGKLNVIEVNSDFEIDLDGDDLIIIAKFPLQTEKIFFRRKSDSTALEQQPLFLREVTASIPRYLSQLPPNQAVNLLINVHVSNGKVFYQTVADLRLNIIEAVKKAENPAINLILNDNLSQ